MHYKTIIFGHSMHVPGLYDAFKKNAKSVPEGQQDHPGSAIQSGYVILLWQKTTT
jgi:hypothetical protein